MQKNTHPIGIGMIPSNTALGSFLRERRLALGLSQVAVSDLAGLKQSNLSALERGTKPAMNWRKAKTLARILKCNCRRIMELAPRKPVPDPTTELGWLIRKRRNKLHMSLHAFARRMKMSPREALAIETRECKTMSYALAPLLAKALRLSRANFAKFIGGCAKTPAGCPLGEIIQSRRKELGLSTGALGRKLSISRQAVSYMEHGKCRLSSDDDRLEAVARALKMDVEKLKAVRPVRKKKDLKDPRPPLAEFISNERLKRHLKQYEVAKATGIHLSTIVSIETGRVTPDRNKVVKIQEALGCRVPDELLPAA